MLVLSLNFVLPETSSVGIYFIFFSTEERKTYKKHHSNNSLKKIFFHKKMKFCHVQQHGWTWSVLCLVK